jgi:F0F1-type ATP synthase assembly protein I
MLRLAVYAGSIGFEIAFEIVVPAYLGYWLDKRYKTGPWLMYLFLAFGIGAVVKTLIRVSRQYKQADQEQDRNDGKKDDRK